MIEDADEQLSEEPQDEDELESVSKTVAKTPMSSKESERKKRELITIGRAKGFLTYDEVNDHMPESIVSSDQIDEWLSTLGGEGIEIVDSASQVRVTEKSGGAEAEEARATPEPARPAEPEEEEEDDGYSKTNDPVRMYLRKMGRCRC